MYTLIYIQPDGRVSGIRRNDGAVIPLDEGNADYQAFRDWNSVQPVPLDLNSISQTEIDEYNAGQARISKKRADIAAALPTWATYRAELTALIDAAQAAANFADLRKVVIDLCQRYRKDAKIIYWLAKDTDD